MLKGLLASALVVGSAALVSAHAAPLLEGRSAYVHHHRHAAHHYHMTYGHHNRTYHGVGFGENHRTTATGGNPGGYSTRN